MSGTALVTGIYASTNDTAIRRVYWHTSGTGKQATKTLHAARTRLGEREEEPFLLEPDYLQRLLSFGCWYLQPAPLRPLEPTVC